MKELQDILKSETGRLLKEYLYLQYNKLNKLDNVIDIPNAQDQAIEVKATKKASVLIRNILMEIMDIETFEKQEKKQEDILYNL